MLGINAGKSLGNCPIEVSRKDLPSLTRGFFTAWVKRLLCVQLEGLKSTLALSPDGKSIAIALEERLNIN